MGWLTGLLRPQAGFSADPADERIWTGAVGGTAQTGEPITPDLALRLSTAWAGVHLIANSIGQLPMTVYQRMARGRREATEHPLYDLLHTQPNPSMSAGAFKAMLTAHALLRGDGLAEIVPGPRGPVDQLRPIHPDRVREIQRLPDYSLRYVIRPENGVGPDRVLFDDQVFHLRGLSLDGMTGVSFVRYGVESLGLARAAEGYAGRVYRNDATPRGVLKYSGKLQENAAKRLKTSWEDAHTGINQHRVALLEEGVEFQAVAMNPEDAQLLASREYQDVDIARWLGVPLFLLQIMTKSTSWGSGIEQIWDVFIATGLGWWATQWEQAVAKDLIAAPQKYYVNINLTALIKGDIEKRYAAYNTGITAGFLTRNEAREREDLNPLDGLDEPLTQLNMGARGREPEPGDEAQEQGQAEALAHYRALLEESAGRVVRKELAALTKASRRCGDDFEMWGRDVRDFYSDHAEFVGQTLQMDSQVAAEYVRAQVDAALRFGVPAITFEAGAMIRLLVEWAERNPIKAVG